MRKDSFPGKIFHSVKSIPQFLLFYHETAPFGQFFSFSAAYAEVFHAYQRYRKQALEKRFGCRNLIIEELKNFKEKAKISFDRHFLTKKSRNV